MILLNYVIGVLTCLLFVLVSEKPPWGVDNTEICIVLYCMIKDYRYPVDLPDKQCLWALTLTPKCLIPSFSFIYGWPLVNTGKNNKKGKPWAAKGWLRSLNKGGHLLDCKTVVFFLKISKETGKAWRKSLTRASLCFQPRLTARACLNTQKYGLFCSLATC